MTPTAAPSVDRRRLRTVLRNERDAVRMTQDQVAVAMDWSLSKVIRIESGAVKVSTNDLRALLDLYGVSTERRSELLALARAARKPPWWAEYREHLSSAFVYYIGLEPNAIEVCYFHSTLVPGIVQTEAYARAAILGSGSESPADEITELRLKVRMRRQKEFFDQPKQPKLHIILDEAALRRVVGGTRVMSRQLGHLIDLSGRIHVKIQVIPFSHGTHTGTFGPYIIMDFAEPDAASVLYLEGGFKDEVVREKPEAIEAYRRSFRQLQASALDPEESVEFIRQVADGFA